MFQIDPMSREPVYAQIISQAERFILTDVLSPGSQIPSVRSVSVTHSVNPRTILKAYTDLDNRGLIQSVPGKGYFVCQDAKEKLMQKERGKMQELTELVYELAIAGVTKEEIYRVIEEAFPSASSGKGGKAE
jgi:GntR family transcriptional regulator